MIPSCALREATPRVRAPRNTREEEERGKKRDIHRNDQIMTQDVPVSCVMVVSTQVVPCALRKSTPRVHARFLRRRKRGKKEKRDIHSCVYAVLLREVISARCVEATPRSRKKKEERRKEMDIHNKRGETSWWLFPCGLRCKVGKIFWKRKRKREKNATY